MFTNYRLPVATCRIVNTHHQGKSSITLYIVSYPEKQLLYIIGKKENQTSCLVGWKATIF